MEYRCDICDKKYSSYQSLWIHNKKFHNNVNNGCCTLSGTSAVLCGGFCGSSSGVNEKNNKKKLCKFCNKMFNDRSNKYKHEKICKNKNIILNNNKPIIEPKNKLLAITKQVNNGNTNNGTINNITINQFGTEKIDTLSPNDVVKLIDNGLNMPVSCVQLLNFNKHLPQNHSFCTTTLEGKHFTKINHETQKPEKINKIDFINQVLDNSLRLIQNIALLIELDDTFRDNISNEHQQKLKDIMNNQDKFHLPKNKKAFFNCINDMSYNFKDLILKTWELLQPVNNQDENNNDDHDDVLLIDEQAYHDTKYTIFNNTYSSDSSSEDN